MRATHILAPAAWVGLVLLASSPAHAAGDSAGTTVTQAHSHPVSVQDSPGWTPAHDPDSLDEVLGRRRNAKPVRMEFHGGPRSFDELGRAVCAALQSGRPDSLLSLSLSSDEFRVILWPEFPASRPATGLHWDDAWQILWGHLNGGSVSAVREAEGHDYTLVEVHKARTREYRNFRLHEGITVTARDNQGTLRSFSFIRAIAERKGRFRIYSMRD
jgi:hypothetical protein